MFNEKNNECFICILPEPSDLDMILLGNSFLRGFYSTHDLSTNKFGFAAHAGSSKADPRAGPEPERHLMKIRNRGVRKYILYIIVGVCLLAGAIVAYVLLRRKKEVKPDF